MAFYQYRKTQRIHAQLQDVWDFISTPHNLLRITPPEMAFKILSNPLPHAIYEGMIIAYRVKPLARIPLLWVTEITKVSPLSYFVDEQRIGPYGMWHHEHIITGHKDGVCMDDIVSYQPPFGVLGKLANAMFIKRRLEKIFDYRKNVMENHFVTPK